VKYRLVYTRRAERDIKKLDSNTRERVLALVNTLVFKTAAPQHSLTHLPRGGLRTEG